MPEPKDMTMAEAATQLHVSVATIRRWIDRQALPARRVGRTIRIPALEFEEWYGSRALRAEPSRSLQLETEAPMNDSA